MSLGPDSAEFLLREIGKDLAPIKDALVTIGAIYLVTKSITITFDIISGVKTFILPKIGLVNNKDWSVQYGKWAGKIYLIKHI